MDAYELMIKTNHHMIQGGELTDSHKATIVDRFMAVCARPEQAERFYEGVRYPNNIDSGGQRMYPVFYIPPYNDGKKLRTVLNQLPKTHILSANMYELEILRLCHLFAPEDDQIADMIKQTLARLKTTCFGYKRCGTGECFDASLVTLRFLAAVTPSSRDWMIKLIDSYHTHTAEKKRSRQTLWYFWLCLSELPPDIAEKEIPKYSEALVKNNPLVERVLGNMRKRIV